MMTRIAKATPSLSGYFHLLSKILRDMSQLSHLETPACGRWRLGTASVKQRNILACAEATDRLENRPDFALWLLDRKLHPARIHPFIEFFHKLVTCIFGDCPQALFRVPLSVRRTSRVFRARRLSAKFVVSYLLSFLTTLRQQQRDTILGS